METHHQQIRAAPKRPVTLADRDVAVLIGVLSVLAGEVRSGEASSRMTRHLSDHLARYGLLSADAASEGLARALSDMNQRLRVARGEYDGGAVDPFVAGPAQPATKPSITKKCELRVTGGIAQRGTVYGEAEETRSRAALGRGTTTMSTVRRGGGYGRGTGPQPQEPDEEHPFAQAAVEGAGRGVGARQLPAAPQHQAARWPGNQEAG